MKTSAIEENNKNRNFDTRISSMLTNFMKSQFEATIQHFQSAVPENSPVRSLFKINPGCDINMASPVSDAQVIETETPVAATEATTAGSTLPTDTAGTEKFQDIIQEASQTHGVPVALINAVIKQESCFNPNAGSHAGAQGLMQLMPATGKAYGCENPFDPRENVMAGTKFLSELLDKYKGNVTLSLAAYNAGPGNVAKYGNTVPPFKETQDYVVKVGNNYRANLAKLETQSQKFAALAKGNQTSVT